MQLPDSRHLAAGARRLRRQAATLGYCLGAYRYSRFRTGGREPASLFVPDGHETSLSQAAATWMVRDLINTPANILGPVELADFTVSLAERYGAVSEVFADAALEDSLSDRSPRSAAVRCVRRAS